MRARHLLEGSVEPETLHVAYSAFDGAWAEIAHRFGGDRDGARQRLAHAILAVMQSDSTDVERVKRDALEVIALAYRN